MNSKLRYTMVKILHFIMTIHLYGSWSHAAPVATTYKRDTSSHTLTVCRGQMRSITCPNLQLLHIYNAFYGKLSGHDCQDPVTQLRDQMPTCFSRNAPRIIRESCQGQQSCDLYAEDSLYHDPCPSVPKYLFVSFTCQGKSELSEKLKMFEPIKQPEIMLPRQPMTDPMTQTRHGLAEVPQIMSAVVCSGQIGSIHCPDLKLLKIKSAIYGKEKGHNCAGSTRDLIPSCYARDTMETVKNICDNQQSCDLYSEPKLYGRTLCSNNQQEYLQVAYTCEGRANLKDMVSFAPPSSSYQRKNLYLRSSLPYPGYPQYYNQQQMVSNNAQQQNALKRNPLVSNTPQAIAWWEQSRIQQAARQRSLASLQQPSISQKQPWFSRQQPVVQQSWNRQQVMNQPATWDSRSLLSQQPASQVSANSADSTGYRHSTCDQCNGDCNNYLCYGCGGCQEPPPEQQTYYYPYQRQDAAYHDAFQGNEMALSGLVMWPVPKIPKSWKSEQQKKHLARSEVSKDDDDDDDDDDDEDDDDNDKASKKDKKEKKQSSKKEKKKIKRDLQFYEIW